MSAAKIIKSKPIIVIAIIALAVFLVFLVWRFCFSEASDAFFAKKNWANICAKVDENKIKNVHVEINSKIYEIDVRGCLADENFIKSMERNTSPPTPYYGNISVEFTDNSNVLLHNWGMDTFSIGYRGTYYLIENEELLRRLTLLHALIE